MEKKNVFMISFVHLFMIHLTTHFSSIFAKFCIIIERTLLNLLIIKKLMFYKNQIKKSLITIYICQGLKPIVLSTLIAKKLTELVNQLCTRHTDILINKTLNAI